MRTVGLCVALLRLSGPPPEVTPTPTPTPIPRLRLDIDGHVQAVMDREPPRFRSEVTRRTPQEAFQEHMEGFDPRCGPGGGGAPTVAEMKPYRPNVIAPSLSVDVLALIAALGKSGP